MNLTNIFQMRFTFFMKKFNKFAHFLFYNTVGISKTRVVGCHIRIEPILRRSTLIED